MITYSIQEISALIDAVQKKNINSKPEIYPYFTQLELADEDFTEKGWIQFPESKKDVESRGHLPYYMAQNCVRYGVNVSKKFDKGDDSWVLMNGNAKEWCVGFHSLRSPNESYRRNKNVIKNHIENEGYNNN